MRCNEGQGPGFEDGDLEIVTTEVDSDGSDGIFIYHDQMWPETLWRTIETYDDDYFKPTRILY